jgi:hypothetical protein
VALGLLLARDLSGPRVGWYLFAGCSLALLPWLLADAVGRAWSIRSASGVLPRRLSLFLMCLVPPVAAGLALGGAAFESQPWALPAYVIAGAATAVIADRGLARFEVGGARDRGAWMVCMLVAVVQLLAAFSIMHWGERTFVVMREGRENLHHQLFAASWFVSLLLLPAFTLRLAARCDLALPRWLRLGVGAVILLGGLAFIEADRRVLVDLHDGLHLWLALIGVLCLDAGMSLFLAGRRGRWFRALGRLSLVALIAAAISFPFQRVKEGTLARSQIAEAPVGTHLLDLPGPESPSARFADLEPEVASALTYDRHHDAPGLDRQHNIMLIVVDTLRADQVGGAATAHAPTLAKLADESAYFERAYATATRTVMSMGTLLMARYPANLDWRLIVSVRSKKRDRLFEDRATISDDRLAELGRYFHQTNPHVPAEGSVASRLSGVGYHTMAVPYVGRGLNFRPGLGFDAGFDDYPDLAGEIWPVPTSTRIANMALDQIDRAPKDKPWFQWVHMFDPHETKKKARYPGLVKHMDDGLGTLLEGLEARGLEEDTIIVFVADHGEGFGEHRERSHASSLYDEQLRIPMILHIPGVEPQRFDEAVSLVDVPSTILAMGGASLDGADGVNLLPLIRGGEYPAHRPIFAELHRWRGANGTRNRDMKCVVLDDLKLIHDRRRGTLRFFDLELDPGEQENLLSSRPNEVERLSRILEGWIAVAESSHPLPDPGKRKRPRRPDAAN